MPKKYDKFPVNFQIALSTYKLDCENKNYIYKIKTQSIFFFFLLKKKASSHTRSACDEASLYYYLRGFPYLNSLVSLLKKAPTSLCLNRDKTKGQSSKNTNLISTKTLPKK